VQRLHSGSVMEEAYDIMAAEEDTKDLRTLKKTAGDRESSADQWCQD